MRVTKLRTARLGETGMEMTRVGFSAAATLELTGDEVAEIEGAAS
jgi:hypothetical protein